MCLTVPGLVIKIEGDNAVVDYQGEQRTVSTALKKDVKVGDYVIVSAKFIMQIIPESEAKKVLEVWDATDKWESWTSFLKIFSNTIISLLLFVSDDVDEALNLNSDIRKTLIKIDKELNMGGKLDE